MFKTMRFWRIATLAAVLATTMFLPRASNAAGQGNGDVASAVQSKLDKKQFQNVKVSVDANGVVTLSGTVEVYEFKMDADKRAHKVKGVNGVRNDIEVSGAAVPDDQLKEKLAEKLAYDRVGYGNLFDAVTIGVEGGVVTLGGHTHNYVDRDSALAIVSTYPGVKGVNDEIAVDPTSIMDDRIRFEVARAVYGYPTLNKYAINPAKPIRISVQNGHVELEGVVDNQADKDTAGIRANGVPGVFSVENHLQVVGQAPSERSQSQR
jgi:osmotically-inducible protein OsmY